MIHAITIFSNGEMFLNQILWAKPCHD